MSATEFKGWLTGFEDLRWASAFLNPWVAALEGRRDGPLNRRTPSFRIGVREQPLPGHVDVFRVGDVSESVGVGQARASDVGVQHLL